MVSYVRTLAVLSLSLFSVVPLARADHEPVHPSDLFVGPPIGLHGTPDGSANGLPGVQAPLLDEPKRLSPLEETEKRLNAEKEAEAQARALEQAQRLAASENLPRLSANRDERLKGLFDILHKAPNPTLARRAEEEIQRIWNKSGSDTIDLLLTWANSAMEQNNYAKALDYLDNIVVLAPDFAEAWNRRATVHFLQQDFGRSIADVEETLRLEPRHFRALTGLGAMLRELGREKEALFVFEKALEVNPTMDQIQSTVEMLKQSVEGRPI